MLVRAFVSRVFLFLVKITICFGLNWPSSSVNSCFFLRRLLLFYRVMLVRPFVSRVFLFLVKTTTCFGLNWPSSSVNSCSFKKIAVILFSHARSCLCFSCVPVSR
jgi:uncharacterized membrane protein